MRRRPWAVSATAGVLGFLGVSAAAGGIALATGQAAPPKDWLSSIPLVDSWLVPGLVLSTGFGLGSLLTAYGLLRLPSWRWLSPIERATRHHWA